jgi:hypothetical protein
LSLLWNSNTSGATSPPNLTNHQINMKYLLTSPSISQIEKWLKIVLTNEKLIKIIHSIFKLTPEFMLFIINIYTNNYLKLNIMLDIATAYPYRLCHYNINKIILGPCPISRFPNMPLCNRAMSISTCFEQSQKQVVPTMPYYLGQGRVKKIILKSIINTYETLHVLNIPLF